LARAGASASCGWPQLGGITSVASGTALASSSAFGTGARADRQCRELIDRIAAGVPIPAMPLPDNLDADRHAFDRQR